MTHNLRARACFALNLDEQEVCYIVITFFRDSVAVGG
jgi:hypothetical protein